MTMMISSNVFAAGQQNVTQNWSANAVFYDSPSDETETFHMSETEFLEYKVDMEMRLVYAYSAYYNSLQDDAEKELLERAQADWIECYYSYLAAYEQRWLNPVKIYFGITGQERKTNVYRETALLMLINRITDLEEWKAGCFANLEEGFSKDKTEEVTEAKEQLQIDMGLCMYAIEEKYRPKIKESNRKFFTFLESNQEFVSLMTGGDAAIGAAEELLQVQRMDYLTGVHYQGCRFFRREREE